MFKSTIAEPIVHNVHIVHIRQFMYSTYVLFLFVSRILRWKKKENFNKKHTLLQVGRNLVSQAGF